VSRRRYGDRASDEFDGLPLHDVADAHARIEGFASIARDLAAIQSRWWRGRPLRRYMLGTFDAPDRKRRVDGAPFTARSSFARRAFISDP
jgi:hypothetical protein